jgi:hypothetical protein
MTRNGGVPGAVAAALMLVLAAGGAEGQEAAVQAVGGQEVGAQDALGVAAQAEGERLPAVQISRVRVQTGSVGESRGRAEREVATERLRREALAPSAMRRESAERRRGLRFSWSDVAHTVGGAVIGGWVGYVGAQVVQSDWAKEANGAFWSQRALWATAGALLGMAGSQVIGQTTAPLFAAEPVSRFDRERRVIEVGEIRDARAATAYEVVDLLRHEWLVTRGTHSLSESARGRAEGGRVVVVPGAPKILVYLNDIRLGGIERMREVTAETLTRAQFLTAREATLRYGMNHTHGAILLSTAVPAP